MFIVSLVIEAACSLYALTRLTRAAGITRRFGALSLFVKLTSVISPVGRAWSS